MNHLSATVGSITRSLPILPGLGSFSRRQQKIFQRINIFTRLLKELGSPYGLMRLTIRNIKKAIKVLFYIWYKITNYLVIEQYKPLTESQLNTINKNQPIIHLLTIRRISIQKDLSISA